MIGLSEATYDRGLIAVGRRPNAENLRLENTGVGMGDRERANS